MFWLVAVVAVLIITAVVAVLVDIEVLLLENHQAVEQVLNQLYL
jgi:hypothetical protein